MYVYKQLIHRVFVVFSSEFHVPSSGNVRRRVLPINLCFLYDLEEVEVGFRICELLYLFDLKAAVFVRNNMCDPDHLAGHLHPD